MFKKNITIFLTDVVAIINFVIKKTLFFLGYKKNKKTLRILVYHSVSTDSFYRDLNENNVKLNMFKQQLQYLKKISKRIVSLSESLKGLEKGNLSYDSIALTFDDGVESVYNEALRVLENLHIPATFFIVYKYVDSNRESLESDIDNREGFMNWRMIFSLKEKGFEIGSHSYSHKRLTTLKDEELVKEIGYAKKKFEGKGILIEYFAYPYGSYRDFSEKIEAFVKEAGYRTCLTNIMGDNSLGDNLFRLKRTRVSWRDNSFRFKMKINGAYDWVDTLKYKLEIFRRKMI